MSVSRKRKEGPPHKNTVLAINPKEDVIGQFSDKVINTSTSYNGEVYRLDNLDKIENVPEFYSDQEGLKEGLERISPPSNDGSLWHDEFFVFDSDGVDEIDCNRILEEGLNLEFMGGPLEDIGVVKNSIDRNTSKPVNYILNKHLVMDYAGFDPEQGYVDRHPMSFDEVLRHAPETLQERLEYSGLDSQNVGF